MSLSIGINVGHDASIAIIDSKQKYYDKATVYESERYSKVKKQYYYPIHVLKSILIDNKDILQADKANFAINSYAQGAKFKEDIYIAVKDYLPIINSFGAQNFSILTHPSITEISHHLAHAYCALFFSPFEKSIILVADGIGSNGDSYNNILNDDVNNEHNDRNREVFESISVYLQDGQNVKLVKKIWGKYCPLIKPGIFLNQGLGSFYGAVANYIFGTWTDSGKVMGLSAYGKQQKVNKDIYSFLQSEFLKPRHLYKGMNEFNNQPSNHFERSANLARTIQDYFEEEIINCARQVAADYPGYTNIIFMGGCALNCLTVSKIVKERIFNNVFIPPCPNDEGISLGTAYFKAIQNGYEVFAPRKIEEINPYLGSKRSIKDLSNENRIRELFQDHKVEKVANPALVAAKLLNQGEIIAWFQGRSECGPRALGNRCILSLPGIPGRKQELNAKIKFREGFRPYGCSVLFEDAHHYFDCPENFHMPYMSFAPKVKETSKKLLSEVTHIDQTCRIQTVTRTQNERYYDLLVKIKKLQGHGLLLNTSLNIMGKPILETIQDAADFMRNTQIKSMILGYFLISKK